MTEELSCLNNTSSKDINGLHEILSKNDLRMENGNISDSDDDNEIRFTKAKPKLKRVTESDSDTNKENDIKKVNAVASPQKSGWSDSSDEKPKVFSKKKKSTIKNFSYSDSEPSEADTAAEGTKNNLSRIKIRNKKLQDKFKKLKHQKNTPKENTDQPSTEAFDSEGTDNSSDGGISCSKIKQKLKKKSSHSLTSICDPDTSDEETNVNVNIQKSKPRSTKLTSPKPIRMSAKQAMENMHKIKSESNRMLREKEVSLPYHRPKALTLKDIMNRRKPAITSDGKSLPIKMNNEQLKQYALMLEERQKELMELCKSDTEEEQDCAEETTVNKCNDNGESNEITSNVGNTSLSDANDKTFDDLNVELNMNDSKTLNDQEAKEKMDVSETLDKACEELANNNQNSEEFRENETENIEEKQEQIMHVLDKNLALTSNVTETCNTNVKKDDQTMEVDGDLEKNEVLLNDINKSSENESQDISLHYDSEKTELIDQQKIIHAEETRTTPTPESVLLGAGENKVENISDISKANELHKKNTSVDFSDDDDFAMEEIERIIEKVEVTKDKSHKILPNIGATLELKPTLTGSPGMVIDLDDDGGNTQNILTGVELLKERFKYFARLKSLEDMEKDREKKFKPGTQHLKLKQELEEQIAEQRSLEWEKRLQGENQLKAEISEIEEGFDGEDIEKIEAKLEETEVIEEEESSSEEEIENVDDCDIKDKPRKRNPLIDDEAEVSEDEDVDGDIGSNTETADKNDGDDGIEEDDVENESEDDDEDSSESDEEEENKTKYRKGRILKAFEDSDDEDLKTDPVLDNILQSNNHEIPESQDDEIQLAQPQKTHSDDLFSSQEYTQKSFNSTNEPKVADTSLERLGSQTFSILNTATESTEDKTDICYEKLDVICETQPCNDDNFDAIVGMCTGGFAENLVTPQAESSQLSQSQEIGDNVLELCTGKFYDNQLVSQVDEVENIENLEDDSINESSPDKQIDRNIPEQPDNLKPTKEIGDNILLKSILEELDDPEFDSPKPNKYFSNAVKSQVKEHSETIENTQFKKKFVIESDDEMNEGPEGGRKKKKRKKRKLENRALHISDDEEEEEYSDPEDETYESDIEQDNEKLVEYDSEENEVEVQAKPKKKRVGRDFFEQEAELTSEDEWVGSGDEDEAGLDRMEREAGDDDTFHQGKLQRELGEIHMREVLDQDKREVRLLQELLFEDGDLGDGHRQRKFRWKNADGDEELGTNADEYADTQEDEFESEEQWRKQRHEREMFLRKLQKKDEDADVTINRSTLIKANLASKATSAACAIAEKTSNLENNTSMGNRKSLETTDKKVANNIPSPKKPFIILQQQYHNSLLTRGRGALARLAALATPLAADDDAPKNTSSNRGNFVFAAITPTDTGAKVTKRKADTAPDTPKLLKKMKQESSKSSRSSLLDHL